MSIKKTNHKKIDITTFWGYYQYLREEKMIPHYKAFKDTNMRFNGS